MVEPLIIERKKLFEHVAAHLEAQILPGKLRPGDQLPPERDLQTSFGVGRPAIREALIALQKAGLVELTNGARARVLMPTASHIFTGMAPGRPADAVDRRRPAPFPGRAPVLREWDLRARLRGPRRTTTSPRLRAALDDNRKAIGDRDQFIGDRHRLSLRTGPDRAQPDLHRAARPDVGVAERAARRHADGERPGTDRLQGAPRDLRGDRRARPRRAPRRRCAIIWSSSQAHSGGRGAKASSTPRALRITRPAHQS